jgi:hypothetical protein
MTYTVLRTGPPEVMAKLDNGEAPDPRSYYFRMSPMFETSARKYEWINRIISVGIGNRLADGLQHLRGSLIGDRTGRFVATYGHRRARENALESR